MSILPRDLVALFPRFLAVRRRGWAGLPPILQASKLERPAFFLLMALVQEIDPGVALSREEMAERLFNPYSTFHPIFDHLSDLEEQGYLSEMDGCYMVTPRGRRLIEETEMAARDYLATLKPLPPAGLRALAILLEEIAQRMWQADEPVVKAHQARVRRLPPITTSSPMVHMEAAIFALWQARDDAHMAAWRAEGLSGPQVDLLSRLWTGEAQELPEMVSLLEQTQRIEDVEQGVSSLSEAGYVHIEGEQVALTEHGRQLRERIEAETDRLYFAPWPELAPEDMERTYYALKELCEALSV